MSGIVLPVVDFSGLKNKVEDGRFTSDNLQRFALKRIRDIEAAHEAVSRIFQEFQAGNHASKGLILDRIGDISNKCEKEFPSSTKVQQLDELKILFSVIRDKYQDFRDLLTEEERAKEEAKQLFLRDCGAKKSQLLRNEQEEYEKNPLFQAFLERIKERFSEATRKTIYFAYAWPTDSRYEKESWVQPFLKNLQAHLKKAGFPIVQLDIVSNRYGANIYQFMEEARTSGYVLLFGTESLLDKFSKGISAVCTELIHILRKREEDGKENVHRVFPILLSGEHRSAFPPEYERFSTIRDWRDQSYLESFQQLFLELLGLPPEDYQPKLRKYWREVLKEESNETPPRSGWYQDQREAIDVCRREGNKNGLLSVQVEYLNANYLDRLKIHYQTRSTISVLTFRKKGKWELTLPVESLYTKLAMIAEQERDERRDLSTVTEDGRLPTHETIFKAKREVAPEKIFKLAKSKRVVIYGSAGIGKTTFTTMLLHKWAKGELFTEFQAVFCIRLRNLTKNFYPKGRTYHASDILNREYESLGLDRLDSDPQTTLLILDGWDELPPETREGGHLERAFQELKEQYPNLLVTSRPGGVDLDATEFEILGFSDKQISDYIDKFFHELKNDAKAIGLREFIKHNHLARSLAHIPINASILCTLFDENEALFNSDTYLTVSALYDRIINQFYKIFLKRRGVSLEEIRTSPVLSFHPDIAPLASCLEEVAYNGSLKKGIYTSEREIARVVYGKKCTIEEVKKLGLYRVENQEGSFIHLTFQEYFAALYISRFYESSETRPQALEIVRRIKFNPKFIPILSMVAGVLSNSGNQEALQSYFDDLHSVPRDLAETYELILFMRCLGECEFPEKLSQYPHLLDRVESIVVEDSTGEILSSLISGNQKLLFLDKFVSIVLKLLDQEGSRNMALLALEKQAPLVRIVPGPILEKLHEQIEQNINDKNSKKLVVKIFTAVGGEKSKKTILSLLSVLKNSSSSVSDSEEFEYEDEGSRVYLVEAIEKMSINGQEIGTEGVNALISFASDSLDEYVSDTVADALTAIIRNGERIEEQAITRVLQLISYGDEPDSQQIDLDSEAVEYFHSCGKALLRGIVEGGQEIPEAGIEFLTSLIAERREEVKISAAEAIGSVISGGQKTTKRTIQTLISLLVTPTSENSVGSIASFPLSEIATFQKLEEEEIKTLISHFFKQDVNDDLLRRVAELVSTFIAHGQKIEQEEVQRLFSLFTSTEGGVIARSCAGQILAKIVASGQEIGENGLEFSLSFICNQELDESIRTEVASSINIFFEGKEVEEVKVARLVSLLSRRENEIAFRPAIVAFSNLALHKKKIPWEGIEALIEVVRDQTVGERGRTLAALALCTIRNRGQSIGKKGVGVLFSLIPDPAMTNGRLYLFDIITKMDKVEEEFRALDSLLFKLSVPLDSRIAVAEAVASLSRSYFLRGEEIPRLIDLLSDPLTPKEIASPIATALGSISNLRRDEIQALIRLLSESEWERRSLFEVALRQLILAGQKIEEEEINALIHLVTEGEWEDIRASAAMLLGEIVSQGGSIGAKGIQALLSLLSDPESGNPGIASSAEALENVIIHGHKIDANEIKQMISLITHQKVRQDVPLFAIEALGMMASQSHSIGEEGVKILTSQLYSSGRRDVAIKAIEKIPIEQLASYYPSNQDLVVKCCRLTRRALIKNEDGCIISDPIK